MNGGTSVQTRLRWPEFEGSLWVVILGAPAASRGSGNTNVTKEKEVRRWFIEQDLIEGVIYLAENLFYNTTAPGIILVLNNAKPKEKQGRLSGRVAWQATSGDENSSSRLA